MTTPTTIIRGAEAPLDNVTCLGSTCADCGGTLLWAEAGYVAWHRICDGCGSHWDEHPVQFHGRIVAATEPAELPPSLRRWRMEWERQETREPPPYPDEELLATALRNDPDVGRWLPGPEEWHHPNSRPPTGYGVPVIGTSWARRARFYR